MAMAMSSLGFNEGYHKGGEKKETRVRRVQLFSSRVDPIIKKALEWMVKSIVENPFRFY